MTMRRRPVAFNMDNALEKGLSEWCDQQSPNNFSGFVKMVLFAYRNGSTAAPAPAVTLEQDNNDGIFSIL